MIINGLLFLWVLLTKYYRDRSLRLPTMEERVERFEQSEQDGSLSDALAARVEGEEN